MPLARRDTPNVLRTVLAIALIVAGCTQARPPVTQASTDPAPCKTDSECRTDFCDSGRCAQPEGVLGAACTPAPRTPEGIRDGKRHTCGPYLCIDGRCRSCTSDAQCQAELGAPRCVTDPARAGSRCGR